MTPRGWSINALSTELGRDRRTVARRIAEAGVRPIETRGKVRLYRLADVVAAFERHEAGSRTPDPRKTARRLLEGLAVPVGQLVPWDHEDVVRVDEYRAESGIDETEFSILLNFGLPVLPPADGETCPRISRPHVERWCVLFSGLVESLGGDGMASRIGEEAARLWRRCSEAA